LERLSRSNSVSAAESGSSNHLQQESMILIDNSLRPRFSDPTLLSTEQQVHELTTEKKRNADMIHTLRSMLDAERREFGVKEDDWRGNLAVAELELLEHAGRLQMLTKDLSRATGARMAAEQAAQSIHQQQHAQAKVHNEEVKTLTDELNLLKQTQVRQRNAGGLAMAKRMNDKVRQDTSAEVKTVQDALDHALEDSGIKDAQILRLREQLDLAKKERDSANNQSIAMAAATSTPSEYQARIQQLTQQLEVSKREHDSLRQQGGAQLRALSEQLLATEKDRDSTSYDDKITIAWLRDQLDRAQNPEDDQSAAMDTTESGPSAGQLQRLTEELNQAKKENDSFRHQGQAQIRSLSEQLNQAKKEHESFRHNGQAQIRSLTEQLDLTKRERDSMRKDGQRQSAQIQSLSQQLEMANTHRAVKSEENTAMDIEFAGSVPQEGQDQVQAEDQAQHQAQIKWLTERLQSVIKERDSANAEFLSAKYLMHSANVDAEEAITRADAAEARLAELTSSQQPLAKVDVTSDEPAKVKQQVAEADSTLAELAAVKEQLARSQSNTTELDGVKEQLIRAQSDLAQLPTVKQQLAEAESNLTELSAIKQQLAHSESERDELQHIKQQLVEAQAMFAELTSVKQQLVDADSELAELKSVHQQQLVEADSKLAETKAKLVQLPTVKEQLAKAQAEVTFLRAQASKGSSKVRQTRSQLEIATSQIEAAKTQLEAANSKATQAVSQAEEATSQAEQAKTQAEEAVTRAAGFEAEMVNLRDTIERLERSLESSRSQTRSDTRTMANLNLKLHEHAIVKRALDYANWKLTLAQDRIKKMTTEQTDMKAKVLKAQEQLAVAEAKVSQTEETLDSTRAELHSTRDELQSTRDEWQSTRDELQSMRAELHSIGAELLQSQGRVLALETKMERSVADAGVQTAPVKVKGVDRGTQTDIADVKPAEPFKMVPETGPKPMVSTASIGTQTESEVVEILPPLTTPRSVGLEATEESTTTSPPTTTTTTTTTHVIHIDLPSSGFSISFEQLLLLFLLAFLAAFIVSAFLGSEQSGGFGYAGPVIDNAWTRGHAWLGNWMMELGSLNTNPSI
jgi:predicted  nucleic acid-binding Zn-ribbon protein